MNQQTIMDLLRQAAECEDGMAINKIVCYLSRELHAERHMEHNAVLGSLFFDTWKHNRAYMPLLYPVIAMLCGGNDQRYVLADIEWEIFDRELGRVLPAKESEPTP